MCGIAGIVGRDAQDAVRRMTGALRHRGPDGSGFYSDDGVSLGHRRLSIIDIDGGQQPITSDDGRHVLVCNGEIYNSPELRSRFAAEGYRFRSRCDVEVILPLYRKHRADCVQHLRGMFAFAIWDRRDKTLFLARDHMGQKPLFYAHHGDTFAFASEVKGILASGWIAREPDVEALWHYMSLRFVPDDRSLIKGVRKLRAGHTMLVGRDGVPQTRYWSPRFHPKFERSVDELTDELEQVVNDVVEAHLLSDVEVGAFLSGGIDSSTVAAIAARHQDAPVSSFSIGVEDQSFDELPYARMVVEYCGLNGHERTVRADLVRMMPSMIQAMDEPSDPFGVGVYLASKLASEHVKVVLSGDGGDENFAGYDRFAGQRLADYYSLLPAAVRKHVVQRIVDWIPESFGYNSFAQKARWLNEMSFRTSGDRYVHSMSFLRFTNDAKLSLYTANARKQFGLQDSADKILEFFESDNAAEIVDRMLYTDLMTRMPDHILTISDRMSMAHSLEVRPVLVDHRLVEFAARLPVDLKLRGRDLKYLLKKVAMRYLPRELVRRKKQGFSFPIARWLRGDLREFTRTLLDESRFVQSGLFDGAYVNRLLDEHLGGRMDHNYRIWILVNLEFWHRMYIENQSIDQMHDLTERLLAA